MDKKKGVNKKKGISKKEILTEAYSIKLKEVYSIKSSLEKKNVLDKIEEYVKRESFEILKDAFQKVFEEKLSEGWIDKAKEIEKYAREKGIEIKMQKHVFRKGLEKRISEGWIYDVKEIEEYAREKGIKIKMDKDKFEIGFEKKLSEGFINDAKKIEQYAREKGIEIKIEKAFQKAFERYAFGLVHGHPIEGEELSVEAKRVLEYAKELGITLKTDFKKDPIKLHLSKKVGDLKVDIYCRDPDSEIGRFGKYVLGRDKNTGEMKLVFDNRYFTHEKIGEAYNLDVLGGGKMIIDPENKKIEVFGASKIFGKEPRDITIKALQEGFPNYKIEEKEEEY